MRTTVRLDPALLLETKRLALDTGRTLTAVIEDALRVTLAPRRQVVRGKLPPLPLLHGGSGLQPGVDLHSNAAMLDLIDEGLDVDSRR